VLRLYVNFFQPQMKLLSKIRQGARVTKRFDEARTPYRRALASPHVSEAAKRGLRATYLELNPAQLKRSGAPDPGWHGLARGAHGHPGGQ
jgi:hypothetical protein